MRTSRLIRTFVVLGLASLVACSRSDAPAAAGAPDSAAAAKPADAAQPVTPAAGPVAATHDPVDVKVGGFALHMEGNTITGNGPSKGAASDGFSVVEVRIQADPPLKLTVRIEPALAPRLLQEVADQHPSSFSIVNLDGPRVEASMTIGQPAFTLAGRALDVAGGRLTVCGIAMGAIEDYDTITLARGEVRVEDVFRGPLPAPVAR